MEKEKTTSRGFIKTLIMKFDGTNTILIHEDNLLHNIDFFTKSFGKKLIIVLKANAYGHGIKEVVKILKPKEMLIDGYQVDDSQELEILRKYTDKKAYLFGYFKDSELDEIVDSNCVLGVYSIEQLKTLNLIGKSKSKRIPVHLCIDNYFGREGIVFSEAPHFIEKLKEYEFIKLEGLYSHFSDADNMSDSSQTLLQIKTFENIKKIFMRSGFPNLKKHISATAGIFRYELTHKSTNDLLRLGIGMYGYWPSKDLKDRYEKLVTLKPVMEVKSIVGLVKRLPKDYPIGYGMTYRTTRETKVAIIPFGYSDGLPRGISNIGHVLINGAKFPIVGRISMNMMTVEISDSTNIREGDVVTILGESGKEVISAEDIAKKINTISYEVLTSLGREKTKRLIVK